VNLGQQLKAIRVARDAKLAEEHEARVRASYQRSQEERAAIQKFWMEYIASVATRINRGQEPARRRVPKSWIQNEYRLDDPRHTHHDLWQDFCGQAARVGLKPLLINQDDGRGLYEWVELGVDTALLEE
jgi:hypothetical protein